jgi:hypothetical protein
MNSLFCYIVKAFTVGYIVDGAKSVFDSVIAVAFQIAFRAEIHVNDVFLFFKNHF